METAPIFDNGQSLNILDYNDEDIINSDVRFFYGVDIFYSIINYVKNIKRINVNKLDDLIDLHKYQKITKIKYRRINKLKYLIKQ